ncbi:MAG: ATP-binding protein [Planctomycetes bacterium]|nr:ATP-binding protein [Planctomycetota bacterium]
MEGQIDRIIKDKILLAAQTLPPGFTRRDQGLPGIRGKAFAVIGMRRAGKTTFLHQCRADLLAAGRSANRLLYFNFEDERLGEMAASQLGLITDIHARLFPEPADEPVTLFLDEIQRVPGWELFVRRLLDTPSHEVFISGSSSRLLSREIATSMRGRAWEIVIQPFSFAEYLRHQGRELPADPGRLSSRKATALDHDFAAFLQIGGFPEAQGLPAPERIQLLQGYIDAMLLRDVVERHGIANVTALHWMLRRLLANPAGLFSIAKFAADLKSQTIAASRDSLHAYLAHFEDAFLLQAVPVATDSEKRRQVNPRKVYPADTGFIPVFDRSGRPNIGHVLETAVFVELQRRRAEVAYVRNEDGGEVDFLARYPGGSQELIQVCASVTEPETLARELRGLQVATSGFPQARQLLLTLESRLPFPAVPESVSIQPAWQWMLAGSAV